LLVRFEASNLRRWQHGLRGLRDSVVNDDAVRLQGFSFGSTVLGDDYPLQAPFIPVTTATAATFTLTGLPGAIATIARNVNGTNLAQLSAPPGYFTSGTPLNYALVTFTDPLNTGAGAIAIATIVGGIVSAVTLINGGSGYSAGTTATLPISTDPLSLSPYCDPQAYFWNFYCAYASYCVSGPQIQVANAAFTSGYMHQFNNSGVYSAAPYAVARVMPQGVRNRQTGQIRLRSKARVKRGI
jgi:hypothetical protein